MTIYNFRENNSRGHWWLGRKEYDALLAAGWKIREEEKDRESAFGLDTPDVPYYYRDAFSFEAETIKEAVKSWESATGRDFFEEGCNCCGTPFSIVTPDYKEYLSGDSVERKVILPWEE